MITISVIKVNEINIGVPFSQMSFHQFPTPLRKKRFPSDLIKIPNLFHGLSERSTHMRKNQIKW